MKKLVLLLVASTLLTGCYRNLSIPERAGVIGIVDAIDPHRNTGAAGSYYSPERAEERARMEAEKERSMASKRAQQQ